MLETIDELQEALHGSSYLPDRGLATANLSDLAPPKWLYYWLFSHPTAPERLSDT